MNASVSATRSNAQNTAADPRASCFLTANAGSGKTSTLVNRVARLLLNGARPEQILCVTYTKAAAAEMQGRLFERLGHWAVTDDDKLAEDLRQIDEQPHDLPRARALFAKALETPGGLKIQTIHAFCEKLLRRFPLEARLSPAFKVLDDIVGQALAQGAGTHVLTLEGPAYERVTAARDRLIRKLKVIGFEKLLAQFIHQHDDLQARLAAFEAAHADWPTALFHSLGLDGVCTSQACLAAYADRLEWQVLRDVATGLAAGSSKTNQEAGRVLAEVHQRYHQDGYFDFNLISSVFMTKDGGPRKTPFTKETAAGDRIVLNRLAGEVMALTERLKAVEIASGTLDALLLFAAFSAVYQDAKRREGALDFTDLINRTKDLLKDEVQAAWVLYKLDGGLDHILVDEAQDTSEAQWIIVEALSSDFFAGEGRTRDIRTLFAVGDEKQSIYGFQGADPHEFMAARQRIGKTAVAAGARFVEPGLVDSWRSLPEILGFVDALFDAPDLAHALNFSGGVIRHVARRSDTGLVELWPLARPIATAEASADADDEQAALDDPGRSPPAKRLAQQIAATIRADIDAGRAVYDKGEKRWRPVHAGDVLILVRKRDHLFEHVIRELKQAGVAVSGADRLKLGDHIAFQDLRALLRFCLQPNDHLSLACVLRSPLCDLSETDLFVLAHDREGSLWRALRRHPATEGPIDEARVFLAWAQKAAMALTAFDFLARVLNRRDFAGRSFRQRFLTRLGDECEDVLDETLALALKAEGVGATSVSACLDLFEYKASEIKREQEDGGRAARVMTVHGSKGLEAPWVIVPMGPQYGARKDDLILTSEDGGLYLCAGGRKADTELIADIRAARALREDQESLRLLYVALTRARDRLTLCGYTGSKTPPAGNFPAWYDLAEAAFERLPDQAIEIMALRAPFDDGEMADAAAVRLFGQRSALMTEAAAVRVATAALPAFVFEMVASTEIETERWAAISQMGDEDRDEVERAPSPLQKVGALGRYRRGNLIHKLFEILPEISLDRRDEVAARYLARQADLTQAQRIEMAGAVQAVLLDRRFAEAFGPQSRPEVALAGQIGVNARGEAIMLSGRIDRLVVTADRVVIIDYKSNRPAPDRAEDAAIAYQRQMAGYVALLRQIHPNKVIEAALLWTDGPKLTAMPETLVNLRLAEILTR